MSRCSTDEQPRAGASAFVLRLTGPQGRRLDVDALQVTIDYERFAHAYGASYADRLKIVAVLSCALAARRPAGCEAQGVPLQVTRDVEQQELTVEIPDLADLAAGDLVVGGEQAEAASQGAVLLAITSGTTGDEGSFRATPLASSSDWQVALGSGNFAWSHPIPVPAPPSGPPPSIPLGYSSGSIDGLTTTKNTQAGPVGLGFGDFANAFVERRYITCSEDAFPRNVLDFCWQSDNAVLSLNGRTAELIPVNRTALPTSPKEWRLASDPDKAHQLHAAARRMVCIVQDVDRWLGECTTTTEHTSSDGTRLISKCTLPTGHRGAHHDANVPLAGRRITGELRDLSDAVERISQHFGWTAPDVDGDLASATGSTTNDHDALTNLAAGLNTLARRATRLASNVRRTEADAPGPRRGPRWFVDGCLSLRAWDDGRS